MCKIIFLFPILFFLYYSSLGQSSTEKIMYVIDSIPVINDPEEGDEILPTEISDIKILKNKDSLKILGFEQFDAVNYFFTKEYRIRPDSLKRIPSTKQMERKNGALYLNKNLYNGPFIDYYYSGRRQGDGIILKGKLHGYRQLYFQNGKIQSEKNYLDGFENGTVKDYYEDGTLKLKGEYLNGKQEGIWESFFPNGQVSLRSNYKSDELFDEAIKYYSNGKIKDSVFIKNGKVKLDKNREKISNMMIKSHENSKLGNNSVLND